MVVQWLELGGPGLSEKVEGLPPEVFLSGVYMIPLFSLTTA